MNQQTTVATQSTSAVAQGQDNHLAARMAQLETEVAELKALLYKFAPSPPSPPIREGYAWLEPPRHLQGVTDYAHLDPEDLVYLHELTDEDVRKRLDELEQWYDLNSKEFYNRWQSGEADDIFEKTEWQMLYKLWLQIHPNLHR